MLLSVHGLHVLYPAMLDARRIDAPPRLLPEYADATRRAGQSSPRAKPRRQRPLDELPDRRRTDRLRGVIRARDDRDRAAGEPGAHAPRLPLLSELVATAGEDPRAIPWLPQDLSRRHYFGRGSPTDGFCRGGSPQSRSPRSARLATAVAAGRAPVRWTRAPGIGWSKPPIPVYAHPIPCMGPRVAAPLRH